MTNWAEIVIAGVILAGYGLFMWKVWPILKENAVVSKALDIVFQMEEQFGGGTGELKFSTATEIMQKWLDKRGWKISVENIEAIITSAVGILHVQQGDVPESGSNTEE